MGQVGRRGRLHPSVASARNRLGESLSQLLGPEFLASPDRGPAGALAEPALVFVACSGGPDSLALAAVAAHFARRKQLRVGALVIDHQLQADSAAVAERAAEQCRQLGLAPVVVKTVGVCGGGGPEKAARDARYRAFEELAQQHAAAAILLAHTLDDQAETVLLGLARGSGGRSLSGMAPLRRAGDLSYLRPFLSLRRQNMLDICRAEGIQPWMDPTNNDQSLLRAKIRHSILPYLQEQLGADPRPALARTAAILGPDSQYLDKLAKKAFKEVSLAEPGLDFKVPEQAGRNFLLLERASLCQLDTALRRRVLGYAVQSLGGHNPSFERLLALDDFALSRSVAGPLQLSGHVSAWKLRPAGPYRRQGILLLAATG